MRTPEKELLCTAAHEAGHAVVARRFTIEVVRATVVPGEGYWGLADFGATAIPSANVGIPSRSIVFWGAVLAELAGPIVEHYFLALNGLPCNFCGEYDCWDIEEGWPLRCRLKRFAPEACGCGEWDCDRCDLWPMRGHATVLGVKEYLGAEDGWAWLWRAIGDLLALLSRPEVVIAIDAAIAALMKLHSLSLEDLQRFDASNFTIWELSSGVELDPDTCFDPSKDDWWWEHEWERVQEELFP